MPLTNPNKVVTEQRLADFYGEIYPYLGGMPEMLANKFSKGDLYSTDEKMIGQWIDGRPLYQKVIHLTNVPLPEKKVYTYLDLTTDTSYELKNSTGFYVVSTNDIFPIPNSLINRTNGTVYYTIHLKQIDQSKNIVLQLTNYDGALETLKDIYVTIQYTKTTDSSIAIGSDTDYSTDEKIIGTWIDGKPIYQKVVPVDISLTWNGFYYAHADVSPLINNVDRIIYSYAYSAQLSACCSIVIYSDHWNIVVSEREGALEYVLIQYTKTTD